MPNHSQGCFGVFVIVVFSLVLLGPAYRTWNIYDSLGGYERYGLLTGIALSVLSIVLYALLWLAFGKYTLRLRIPYLAYVFPTLIMSISVAYTFTPFARIPLIYAILLFCAIVFLLVALGVSLEALSIKQRLPRRAPIVPLDKLNRKHWKEEVENCRRAYDTALVLSYLKEKSGIDTSVKVKETLSRELSPDPDALKELEELTELEMLELEMDGIMLEYLLNEDSEKFCEKYSDCAYREWKSNPGFADQHNMINVAFCLGAIMQFLASQDKEHAREVAVFLRDNLNEAWFLNSQMELCAIKAFIAAVCDEKYELKENNENMQKLSQKFIVRIFERLAEHWVPYIDGLAKKDIDRCVEGIVANVETVFGDETWPRESPHFRLNIMGIGLTNLARMHGINVPSVAEIIPEKLLFPSPK